MDTDPLLKRAREESQKIVETANASAATILAKAKEDSERTVRLANEDQERILAEAKKAAKIRMADVEPEIARLKKAAEDALVLADKKALEIVQEAKENAEKIAGDAYKALEKSESLTKTAEAMKNIIEGYGDRYIVPMTSLIDHLGEDFSHTDAGAKLKAARSRTRLMIKNETAAECDYVENHRRKTAIEFVLDAFNGKVESILSDVKAENYGTLERKIQDACQTVNHNGTAFRNARIVGQYLESRLDECKWACTVQALKDKEREEQRRIREQMREEEKAAREIEKALREAQKEEETLHKAMDKVRKELESASEQQRLKYEAKLTEYQEKLAEAEERNKRALSMAQQTKRGHVYIISNVGSFGEDILKVGMTRRLDPMDRIDELGDASVPFDFDVHAMIFSEDAPGLEKELHARFAESQVNKVNPRKEFFRQNVTMVRKELEMMGIQAHWTMLAEAKEYKESLAAVRSSDGKSKAG